MQNILTQSKNNEHQICIIIIPIKRYYGPIKEDKPKIKQPAIYPVYRLGVFFAA